MPKIGAAYMYWAISGDGHHDHDQQNLNMSLKFNRFTIPSGNLTCRWNMAIEIVDLPIENPGSFHRFLYVYPYPQPPRHRRVPNIRHPNFRSTAAARCAAAGRAHCAHCAACAVWRHRWLWDESSAAFKGGQQSHGDATGYQLGLMVFGLVKWGSCFMAMVNLACHHMFPIFT